MKIRTPISMVLAAGLLGGAVHLVYLEGDAAAQSSTSGAVRGQIRDTKTGEPVIGATVVITGPALQGQQAEITDENGRYVIQNLPPGTYLITVFYNEAQFNRPNVLIQVGKQAVVNVSIDTDAAVGETIVVEGRAPIIDQGSTKTGSTITSEYTDNIPVGRTFGAVLGTAPGSQGDTYGISFGGSTSVENTYIVEGINTTDTGFGLLSSNLPNEFVQETEVITGGYNAEFGRSTGGVVNVVTKQGGNTLRGSVFAYFTPGQLVAEAVEIKRQGNAIGSKTDLDYAWDVGAEVGGPIVKDKLWFHVGVNPSYSKSTLSRIISSRVADADGNPAIDPETGFEVLEEVGRSGVPINLQTIYYTAKVNGAVSEDHQFQISAFGNPRSAESVARVVGSESSRRYKFDDGALDGALKWTSKFAEGKTQIDVVFGFHRGFDREAPFDAAGGQSLLRYDYTRPLTDFAMFEPGATVPAECMDGTATDPLPGFTNCPVIQYGVGGIGFFEDRTNDRYSAILSATQRVKAAGYHTFKAGIDVELTTYDSLRGYTGDTFFRGFDRRNNDTDTPGPDGRVDQWQARSFVKLDPMGEIEECVYINDELTANCAVAEGGLRSDTKSRSIAGYVQDSWQVRPNLTLNAGLRLEQQIGYVAEEIQGTLSPEGETVPEIGFKLDNMLAPRLGVIYDPTQEGRSKLFAHWGRFYESVPMDINVRAFGGEMLYFENVNTVASPCAEAETFDPAELKGCSRVPVAVLGGGTEYVTPNLKGQYLEELVIGAEYEFMPDFKLGLNYVHRELPVVIEDLSTDGGHTYFIANPGRDYSAEAADLRRQGEALIAAGDEVLGELYLHRADLLDAVKTFDKPVRTYDAIQVTANQRFSKNALLLASYTYSRSKGNFPGLFSTETGQLDPNLTSMYDLADLMANRYGPLGHDRPHNVKVDGFYLFDLKTTGHVVLGASFRAQSGLAANVLAAHTVYGTNESYVLPRGAYDRGPMTWQADIKATYGKKFGTTTVEAFMDVFNLFDNQEETRVDETYTLDAMNPIVGGDRNDLRHSKITDGAEINSTAVLYQNFGNTRSRQAPRSFRFGLRVTF